MDVSNSNSVEGRGFISLEDAKDKLERWRNDYNKYRLHSAVKYLPPAKINRNHVVLWAITDLGFAH